MQSNASGAVRSDLEGRAERGAALRRDVALSWKRSRGLGSPQEEWEGSGAADDAQGRQLTETGPLGTTHSGWDSAGCRITFTWPDNFYVSYDYDAVGEMTAIHENGGVVLDAFGYDDLGRRTSLTRSNGVATAYGYDAAGQVSSLSQSFTNGAQNDVETFGYNVAGQVTSRTLSNDGWAWTNAYNVDRAYTPNRMNQPTSSGAYTLNWGSKGDLDGDGGADGDGTLNFAYDDDNRMYSAGNGSAQAYDGLGRLFSACSGGATRFLYDGPQAVGEYNSSNAIVHRYVFGPAADEPLVEYDGGVRYALTADRLGSVTSLSGDSGAAAAINAYDEYGLPNSSYGIAGRFGYTGQMFMGEFGLYSYKAWLYSPTLGQFVQPDPIGYGDGANFYAYVHGDPVNGTDPYGLDLRRLHLAAARMAAGTTPPSAIIAVREV